MTQPVAGLTLFTLMVASSLRSVLAQLPTLQPNTAQALPQNFSGQQTAYILGGGERPGSFTIGSYILLGTATNQNNPTGNGGLPTVTLAIQQEQGIKPLADIRRIDVRRLTKIGAEQVFNINLWQLLQTGNISQEVILQDGDTVVVPKATEVATAESLELATALFSPDTINISVVGEVETPGTLKVPPNTTLNQALLTAGGFKGSRARRSSVDLIRLNIDGTVSTQEVPINLAQGVNDQGNPILWENDIIVVSRAGTTRITDSFWFYSIPQLQFLQCFRYWELDNDHIRTVSGVT